MSSDWRPPTELPDLRRVGILALDTETQDDGLRADRGPAWPWRGGHVAGVSVAYHADGGIRSHYFPIRHPESTNFEPEQVFRWLQDLVASDVRFVTQNGLYDWGWLRADGDVRMPPAERLEEIGAMATLIDENLDEYKLDALCKWRGLAGKDLSALERAVAAAGFAPKRKNQKIKAAAHIWQLPAQFVGSYAEADAASTLALWENLNPVLDREGTRDAYHLEVDLLPMVHAMRHRGVRIDQNAAEQARDRILQKRDAALAELSEKLGAPVGMDEIGSPLWKARTFDAQNIKYPLTEKGNPSLKTGWMEKQPHWLPQLITQACDYNAAGNKFLKGHILEHVINGRIHAEIHPHRGDDGTGARSFRFSYSHPPLQQMPARDKEIGPLIRGVFLPEPGEVWAKPDISQQEFRLLVHYAELLNLPRVHAAAEEYRTNPNADIHAWAATMTGLARDDAKPLNYAKIYGGGVKRLAEMLDKSVAEAKKILAQYDRDLPFVSRLSAHIQREAHRLGYTVLYDGARRHWDYWEARNVFAKGYRRCPLAEAKRRIADQSHPWYRAQLRRANVHTALNALLQGSAARHTKLWMRAVWREGIVPLLQMHDSLDCSVTSREQGELVARLGCEAVSLKVPMRVDLKFGHSWGDATHTWEELHNEPAQPNTAAPSTPQPEIPAAPKSPANGAVHPAIPALSATPTIERQIVSLRSLIEAPLVNGKMCCPFHDDRTPSMAIYDDHFHCFGCPAHGDQIDWLMMVDGLSRDEAIQLLDDWDGPLVVPAQSNDTAERKRKRDSALQIWQQGKPIAGTLAAEYLSKRGCINLAAPPANIDDVLRFHPHCTFGPGVRRPCLLALMRDAETDEPTGIQRTALRPDATKIGRKMFGPAGVVKLWPAGAQLVIGEGIETVAAAAAHLPYSVPLRPAWAALSDNGVERFPIIAGVERLIILVDHDENGVGQAAALACQQRWQAAGRTGVLLTPERPGSDFNDVVVELLRSA